MSSKQKEKILSLIKSLPHPDYSEIEKAYRELKKSKSKFTVPLLIKSLQDREPLVRKFCADILGEKKEPDAVLPLIENLKDPDVRVIVSTIIALGEIGDKRSTEEIALLLKDESPFFYFIRLCAIDALAKIGDLIVVPTLIEAIKEDDIIFMRSIVETLITIDPQSAVSPLIEILQDKESLCRDHAAEFLGLLEDKNAIDPLINVLKEEDIEVKICALQALSKIGREECLLPLINIYKEENNNIFKKTIQETIKYILKQIEIKNNNNLSKELIEKIFFSTR